MRLRKTAPLVVAVALASVLGGCALSFDARALGVRATMSEPAGQPVDGAEFRINRKAVFLLLGMFPVAQPSLDQVLAGQLVDGTEVVNLSMKVRSRFPDLLVTVLTLGLVVPRTVTYEGVVVTQENP